MRYASVCSGVEAASLAWMPLGWEAVWFSEIEPFPCAVLKERFPDVPNLGDMTKIKGEKYHGTVDLLVGGTPCQGFSVAGKQGGLNDPRSVLCLAYCGLLETMRPRWFVWENVPGVFSTNQGADFRAFLGKIDEIGYSVAWRVLDAQYVRVDGYPRAVPQRRRRVFVVGHLGDWRYPASVLFEPESLQRDTPPRRVKGAGVARSLMANTGGASGKEQQHTFISGDGRPLNVLGVDGYNGVIFGQVSATVDINCKNVNGPTLVMANGQANSEVSEAFSPALTCDHESPIVCAGFSGGQGEKADHANAIGRNNGAENCVCQYGDVAGSLTARYDSSPCADRGMNVICYENHAQDNAKAGTGGGNLPILQEIHRERETHTIAFRWAASPSQGLPVGIDYCHTMMANKNGEPAVCYPINGMVIGKNAKSGDRQTTGIGEDGDPIPTISSAHHHAVAMRQTVRRLLPVECERLMGFPDNWTRISWRGKPEEQCPDGHRYKACGNSMCVNVMRWIGMRIENLERRMKGIDNEQRS